MGTIIQNEKETKLQEIQSNTSIWNMSEKEEEEAFCEAHSYLTSGIKVPILKAIIDIGILDMISQCGPGGRMSATEIASRLPTSNPEAARAMVGCALDFLVTHSVLTVGPTTNTRDGGGAIIERRYGLGPVSRFFVPDEHGVSFIPSMSEEIYKTTYHSSLCLKDAILKGTKPFTEAFGMSIVEYDAKHAKYRKDFHEALSNYSIVFMRRMLSIYRGFEGISTLVDVGGGNGHTINMIISQYPHIKGINFDQPHIIANAPSFSGVEHIGGDMLIDNIPKGDAIFLKSVCHCFEDEVCVKILKKCYEALPKKKGKVILCECNLQEPNETNNIGDIISNSVVELDLIMMLATHGGKERTRVNFQDLAFSAGFQGFQVVCSVYNITVMELLKIN